MVPPDKYLLPEPMLTLVYVAIYCHYPVGHNELSNLQSRYVIPPVKYQGDRNIHATNLPGGFPRTQTSTAMYRMEDPVDTPWILSKFRSQNT